MPECCSPDPTTGAPLEVTFAPAGDFLDEPAILCVYANPPSVVCQTPEQTGCLPPTRFEAHPVSGCPAGGQAIPSAPCCQPHPLGGEPTSVTVFPATPPRAEGFVVCEYFLGAGCTEEGCTSGILAESHPVSACAAGAPPAPVVEVPTLDAAGAAVLTLGLVAAALWRMRRRPAPAPARRR